MKPALCRMTLLGLFFICQACGCATLTPTGWGKSTASKKQAPTTLTAGFPRLGQIRIPKPGAKAAYQRNAARNSPSIKQRAEATRQANRDKEKQLSSSEPQIDSKQVDSKSTREPKTPEVTPTGTLSDAAISQAGVSDDLSRELAGFDQTTQALIRSELRDAPPDERNQLLQDLKGVSSDMVPKILGIRRAALNYKADSAKGKIAPTNGILTTSPSSDTSAETTEGLGTNSPWKANYAPPPVGSGTPNTPPTTGPAFSTSPPQNQTQPSQAQSHQALTTNQTLTAQQAQTASSQIPNLGAPPAGIPPEQLAAQILAGNSSVGLPAASQNSLASGMTPVQTMGMLNNGQIPGMPVGNQTMIPIATSAPSTNGFPANPGSPYTQAPIATSAPAATTANGPAFTGIPAPATSTIPAVPVSSTAPVTAPNLPPASQGWANGNLPNYNALPAAVHSPEWQQHLQGLISAAEQEVGQLTPGTTEQEKQRYIEAHVHLRMLYMMAGQQQRALAHIPGVDPADQEFWQQVMWGTTNYFDSRQIPAAADRATQTVSQFQAASSRLREKAHLEVRGMNFCNQIYGFGDIEKFLGGNEFTPGTQVLVYAEISNFKSELSSDGRYHSKLKPSYEILRPGGQGQLVEQKNVAAIEDVCNNHRQDFYLYFNLTIPEKIGPGPHILRLTVEDELNRKIATQTLNFTVK